VNETDETGAGGAVALSVVIPARNEAKNLPRLVEEVGRSLAGSDYEVIIVDDGSTDDSAAVVARMAAGDPRIRLVSHPQSCGQSGAIASGVRNAGGALVVTLDGDGQNDPKFIPALLAAIEEPEVGLVAGQRIGRKDTFTKRYGSWIANAVRGRMLGDRTRDTGCGLKAFRREAFLELPYFDALHRFLPALFISDGWAVRHVDVVDRPRRHGTSHYGIWDRLAVGVPDLFGVWWLRRRRRRNPARLRKGAKT